jgi:hypothetical protein
MEPRIDLEEAARVLSAKLAGWRQSGIQVGAITWRDVGEPWPYPLKGNRAEVIDADSLGIALSKGKQEGRLVLFTGGWADLEYWSGSPEDGILTEAPGWDDWLTVADYNRLLDRFAGLFESRPERQRL